MADRNSTATLHGMPSSTEEVDRYIREQALQLAASQGGNPHEVVERARAYAEFLRGDANVPSALSAPKPIDLPRF